MHIVFLGYEGEFEFADSIIGMFVMSLGEFGDIYDTYDATRYPTMAKVCNYEMGANKTIAPPNVNLTEMI